MFRNIKESRKKNKSENAGENAGENAESSLISVGTGKSNKKIEVGNNFNPHSYLEYLQSRKKKFNLRKSSPKFS